MKEIKKIATADNFTAVNVGRLSDLGDYELSLGADVHIDGKVFCGAAVGATVPSFLFSCSNRTPKQGSSIHMQLMRSSISSSRATASFRWTERFSLLPKAVSSGLPLPAAVPCAITVMSP